MTPRQKCSANPRVTFFVSGSSRYIHFRPSTAASPNSRGGGFSTARFPLPRESRWIPDSRRIRLGRPEPPAAGRSITHQDNGGQRRVRIIAQPNLELHDLDIHPAASPGHAAPGLPPAHPLKPSDGLGADGPLPAVADHCRWHPAGCLQHHMFHALHGMAGVRQ